MLNDDTPDRSPLRALFRGCYSILLGVHSANCSPARVGVSICLWRFAYAVGYFGLMYAPVVCRERFDRVTIAINRSRSLFDMTGIIDCRVDHCLFGVYE